MRIESIISAQNPKIKDLLALQEKSKERRKKGLFVVEGRRELLHCIEAGYEPYTVFICPEILQKADFEESASKCGCNFIEIPQHLYDKVAYRGGTEGVIAELHCKEMNLDSLKLKKNGIDKIIDRIADVI